MEQDGVDVNIYTNEGNEYKLTICPFNKDIIPENITVELYDVQLKFEGNEVKVNNYKTFSKISNVILNFLEKNKNACLYYYCATKYIFIRKKKEYEYISPQKYRSILFSKIFDCFSLKQEERKYKDRLIFFIEENKKQEEHYIHLISHKDNVNQLKEIEEAIKKMKNKQDAT